jgi:hypothetical protein
MLLFAAPGSVRLIKYSPDASNLAGSTLPAWARPCLADEYSSPPPRIGFCARADGRVVGFITKDGGETHLLVTGGFHFTLVELKRGTHRPSWGSRIIAVGPMTTSDGLRELKAIRIVNR